MLLSEEATKDLTEVEEKVFFVQDKTDFPSNTYKATGPEIIHDEELFKWIEEEMPDNELVSEETLTEYIENAEVGDDFYTTQIEFKRIK